MHVMSRIVPTPKIVTKSTESAVPRGTFVNEKKPVSKGFETFIALAQSFWTLCFVIS